MPRWAVPVAGVAAGAAAARAGAGRRGAEHGGRGTGRSMAGVRGALHRALDEAAEGLRRLAARRPGRPAPVLASAGAGAATLGGGSGGKEQERILICDIKLEGATEELRKMASETLTMRPNFAYTLQEVQGEVDRVFSTGYFKGVTPIAEDTRDGIVFKIVLEENEPLRGVHVKGASVLPAKVIEDACSAQVGKTFSSKKFYEVCELLDQWYRDRGFFAQINDNIVLKRGIAQVQVAEAVVGKVTLRFKDANGADKQGVTKEKVILREMTTKKGQILNLKQAKSDIEAIMAMGIFDDVTIQPIEMPESTKERPVLEINMNLVERKTGGFSAGGGISAAQSGDGPFPAFIGSCSYSQRNLFGLNQKFSASMEMGTADSLFRIHHTDPWILGDPYRTSRTISVQNTKSGGNSIHGKAMDSQADDPSPEGGVNVGRLLGGIEYARPLATGWNGTTGIQWQRSRVLDEHGTTLREDSYGSPVTFSGGDHDEMCLALLRTVYTAKDSQLVLSMEQAIPLRREWLNFNRLRVRCARTVHMGPLRLVMSGNGGAIIGDLPPYEAFPIGGTNSVRGYGEGGVGAGRNYISTTSELHLPLIAPLEGCIFFDYGTDLDSGARVLGDPAGARGKPGSGYGFGGGVRLDSPVGPLRLEYAWNDKQIGRFHFGIGSG